MAIIRRIEAVRQTSAERQFVFFSSPLLSIASRSVSMKSRKFIAKSLSIAIESFTYNCHLAAASCTVALLVPRPTRIDATIRRLLHRTDHQQAVRLHLLSDVVGQFASTALPMYLLDGVSSDGTL